MRKPSSKSDKQQPKTPAGGLTKRRLSFEWPLLIYPVLFLATLGILYVVNRSIEKESPATGKTPRVAREQGGSSAPAGDAAMGDSSTSASGLTPRPQPSTAAAGAGSDQAQKPPSGKAASKTSKTPLAAGKLRHTIDVSQLKGAAKTVAMLRIAVEEKDQALIKQCLADLVAMGEEAVVPLTNVLVGEESDTALWAATALARIGTPTAAGALLDRLSQTQEGAYKEELGKRVSTVSNHDSWPLLLDTMMQGNDSAVVRAAGTALSRMADAPIVDEVIARYGAASTPAEAERLAQLVRNMQSPKATESLLSLAGHPSALPQDSLQSAAIEALAKIGDAPSVNYLLQRLEASPPGQSASIFNTITQINGPEAQTPLLYAAAGSKEVSAEHGQTAAIYALKNYPNEKTVALLERIVAQEQNEKVLTAATRTLDEIKRSPHAVSAKADAFLKSEQMLPLKTIEK